MLFLPFPNGFLADALHVPVAALSYELGRRIQAARPGRFVFETSASAFAFADFLDETRPTHREKGDFRGQFSHTYCEENRRVERTIDNAVYEVEHEGETLEVVVLSYSADDVCETRYFLIADSKEIAERFFAHVCRWSCEVRGELLVFQNGGFEKDEELYRVISASRLDNLVLKGSLKEDIVGDVTSFFQRKHVYEKYGVPHKRGILFYGPPGNGKTHLLKGLVRAAAVACIYVRSLQGSRAGGHELLSRVFQKARAAAPCVLVFEDLETIVTDENRSFFLNELDGFHKNSGILTLATTNYPERIDPAIVDRPSRFDRKYCLELPGHEERMRFLATFSSGLRSEMQIDASAVRRAADLTSGFSFAYLKELTLSALMSWVECTSPGSMGETIAKVATLMQDQVRRGKSPGHHEGRRVGLVPQA